MPSRRTHNKSRHGCTECKVRKVKCDETRPHCLRCTTRKSSCHYSEVFRSNNLHSTPPASNPSPNSGILTPVDPNSPLPLSSTTFSQDYAQLTASNLQEVFQDKSPLHTASRSPVDNTIPSGFRHREMELLHHYTTSTFLTLQTSPETLELWQIVVPKMAFSNDFLLHGLLSLSACHFAYSMPEGADKTEYQNMAKDHYTTGISLFRPLLNHMNNDNVDPIVSFAMLVIILSMAIPTLPKSEQAAESGYIEYMINTLRLVKGVKEVLAQSWPFMMENSVLRPIVTGNTDCSTEALGFEASVSLKSIEAHIQSDIPEGALRQEYLEAVRCLKDCTPRKEVDKNQQGIILAWPAKIPAHFFEEMADRKPIALAILTFYGTLLHKIDDLWWADGKGKKLVEATTRVLPRGWESMVVWGRMSVGLPCDFIPR